MVGVESDWISLKFVYQTMPHIATQTPKNFFNGIESPKKMHPPVKMMTVLRCPTTLYVRLDVAPMTRKVLRETRRPRTALMMLARMADHE